MKSKIVGYLISAVFVLVVVAIAYRISTVRNFVFSGSAPSA